MRNPCESSASKGWRLDGSDIQEVKSAMRSWRKPMGGVRRSMTFSWPLRELVMRTCRRVWLMQDSVCGQYSAWSIIRSSISGGRLRARVSIARTTITSTGRGSNWPLAWFCGIVAWSIFRCGKGVSRRIGDECVGEYTFAKLLEVGRRIVARFHYL